MNKLIILMLLVLSSFPAFSDTNSDSFSCGNNICESVLNENQATCPVDCKTNLVTSFNYETLCNGDQKLYSPNTISDVQSILKNISMSPKPYARFVGSRHSISSIICGKGNLILVEKFNKILSLGQLNNQKYIEVESGVTLGELSDYLDRKNLSLGFGYPAYRGLTIGGLLATGAHGSSRIHTGVSSQNILEMTVVKSDGELLKVDASTPKFLQAFKVHLGLLGFVYKIKLKVEPQFNLDMQTFALEGEQEFFNANQVVNFGAACDSESIAWFPYTNKAIKFCGNKTNEYAMLGAESIFLGSDDRAGLTEAIEKMITAFGGDFDLAMMKGEALRVGGLLKTPPFVAQDDTGATQYLARVIGPSNKMLLSKQLKDTRLYKVYDTSFSFPIEDSSKVLKTIRDFSLANNFGLPMMGFYMRFAKSDANSFLSHIENGRDKKLHVVAEFLTYKYFNISENLQEKYTAKKDQLIQELITRHRVKFHWGKNTDPVFLKANIKKTYGENLQRFQEVRQYLDPKNMFSNPLLDKVLK